MELETTEDLEILPITFTDKHELYRAFMPFIKHGGLFIQTEKKYQIGDQVMLLVKLVDDVQKLPVQGKVVWLIPSSVRDQTKGVGIQFVSEESELVCRKIETIITGISREGVTETT